MSYKLLESPWIAATSVFAGLVAIANSISSPFDLTPFWTDTIVLIVLLGAAFHWILHLRSSARSASHGDDPFGKRPHPLRRWFAAARSSFYVPIVLIAAMAWTAAPLVAHAGGTRRWALCATFVGPCRQGACLKLLDTRKRALGSCAAFADDSGFYRVSAEGFGDYRPVYAASCAAADVTPVRLPETAFDDRCDSVVRLQ